jgi:hypothetical protein
VSPCKISKHVFIEANSIINKVTSYACRKLIGLAKDPSNYSSFS